MNLTKGIVIHISDEARKEWEKNNEQPKNKKGACPSCEIEELKNNKIETNLIGGTKN
jgi:hypothetical protein